MTVIYAYLSTIGFSILFNIPKKNLFQSGFVGAMGWMVYVYTTDIFNAIVFSAFLGAFTAGMVSEIFARIYKAPATLFLVPGIIPLVPGYGLYYAMLKSLENDYDAAIRSGLETLLVAIAIASAITATTSIGKMIKRWLFARAKLASK